MLIVKLSQAQNVQVFATTHSQESLESAVRTADAAGKLGELRYYRLRRDKQSQIKNVAYNGESLKNNIMESWEVR
jgi:AAA15 family ATPase/GTPase